MSGIKKVVVALVAFVAAHAVQATPIQTVHGFVPLQKTENLSIDDFFKGVGGWIQSYHIATDAEVRSLLNSYGITQHPYAPETVGENNFIHQIGGEPYGTSNTYGPGAAVGFSWDYFVSVSPVYGDNPRQYQNCPAYTDCTSPYIAYSAQSYGFKSDGVGLFLVAGAPVPEPASLALVSLGIAMLLMRRRPS
jgi:hypothetical protein